MYKVENLRGEFPIHLSLQLVERARQQRPHLRFFFFFFSKKNTYKRFHFFFEKKVVRTAMDWSECVDGNAKRAPGDKSTEAGAGKG